RSIVSPGAGTLPETWLSKPASVVTASSVLSPNFTPSNSSTSPIGMLPRITRPPSGSRTTSGAGGFPAFPLSPTISSTRSSTVAIPATVPCSSITTVRGFHWCVAALFRALPFCLFGLVLRDSRERFRAYQECAHRANEPHGSANQRKKRQQPAPGATVQQHGRDKVHRKGGFQHRKHG